MSNLPISFDPKTLPTAAKRAAARLQITGGGQPFLRLIKSGDWVFGSEDTDVEPGSKWLVHAGTLSLGYSSWGDGELLGEAMATIFATQVDRANLPETGQPWKQQVGMMLVCLSGTDKGTQVVYKNTSIGGTRAFGDLLNAVIARSDSGEEKEVCPIVVLERDSYQHKKYGRTFTPIFKIVGWAAPDATEPTAAAKEPPPAKEVTSTRRKRRVVE